MRLTTAALAGIGLMMTTLVPTQSAAQPKIFAYHGPNYCPAGYQPVQINGVICCGQPNAQGSYSMALAHPMPKRKVHRHVHKVRKKHRPVYSARAHCEAGVKGCN